MKRMLVLLSILLYLCGCAPAGETVTADTPVPGEDPFGNTYYYRAAVLFDGYIGGAQEYETCRTMSFAVAEDGRFVVDGVEAGRLEEMTLTEENFDARFSPKEDGPYNVSQAAVLRAENDRAWAIGTDHILLRQDSGAMLLLDQSSVFDAADKPVRLFRLGKTPLGESGKERWYGTEDAAAVETSLNFSNGSAYISTACIFRSSGDKWLRPDSNYYYYVDGKDFVPVLRWWMEERGRTTLSTRTWHPIPWVEEVWQRKPYYDALMEIAADGWRYLPLDGDRYFLSSGNLLFLWDGSDLYRLEQMDSIAAAKWSYFERLDRDHLPLELVFERENRESCKEIWLDCEQGQVFGVYQDLYTGQRYRFPTERDLLYWSPMNDDGSRVEDVMIEFALLKGDDRVMDEDNIFLRGTITAELNGTVYKNVRMELDGDLPEGIAVSVLDWKGKVLQSCGK